MEIDFIADVVCPWCYIGWRRLREALALRPEVEATVIWRPFLLDPTIPEQGVDRAAYMAKKFGDDAKGRKAMVASLTAAAAESGLKLKLGQIKLAPNTNAAQRLIRWARGQGVQDAVVEGLMAAYFTQLRDIGDPEVLADIGQAAGMDRMLTLELLSQGADKQVIADEYALAVRTGVQGVPFTIFGGKVAVVGAESPKSLVAALDRALGMAA